MKQQLEFNRPEPFIRDRVSAVQRPEHAREVSCPSRHAADQGQRGTQQRSDQHDMQYRKVIAGDNHEIGQHQYRERVGEQLHGQRQLQDGTIVSFHSTPRRV